MSGNSFSENAGVVAPAPVIFGAAIAVGLAAEFALPIALLPQPLGRWLAVIARSLRIPTAAT